MKNESSHGILYREWVPIITALKVLVGGLILLNLILMGVFALAHQSLNLPLPLLIPIFSLPTLFLLLMIVNYRGIDIRITPDEVRIHYGIANRKRISRDNIVGCEVISASFRRYGGIGVRYGLDGTWAYTTSFGPAVRISLSEGKPFVFSSKDPEKICSIIEELKTRHTTQETQPFNNAFN